MRPVRTASIATLPSTVLLLAGLVAFAVPAHAHEYRAGDIEIRHPVAPAPPPGAPSVAGYLTLVNVGDTDDRLVGATAGFAEEVEMHATTLDGDVARMRTLAGGIAVPAGATVTLLPGETHLMFVDPAAGIVVGDTLPVTLRFEHAGDVEVAFDVEDGVEGMSAAHADPAGHDMAMPAKDADGATEGSREEH